MSTDHKVFPTFFLKEVFNVSRQKVIERRMLFRGIPKNSFGKTTNYDLSLESTRVTQFGRRDGRIDKEHSWKRVRCP